MKDSLAAPSRLEARPVWSERMLKSLVVDRLDRLRSGRLTVLEQGARSVFGRADTSLAATIVVHSPDIWRRLALGGSLGAAESYMDGEWEADDLVSLIRILARDREVLDGFERGWGRLARPVQKLLHFSRRNSRAGSRKNIAAHYDLGNDFFRLFLDPTLSYSSLLFPSESSSLHVAALAKFERVVALLDLGPEHHLLEIGTGWGGLAIHVAQTIGCRVTTTTISREQAREARARIEAAGLGDRVEVLELDYRDLTGRFDRVVSIEMIEAVGHAGLDGYFAAVSDRLEPDGRAVIQAITMADRLHARYLNGVDFIQKHVFPGGCLPSISSMAGALSRSTDLTISGLHDITPHYARTLAGWSAGFESSLDEVRALGYDERFIRMWRYYLGYCEGGFREGVIGAVHLALDKPLARAEVAV